MAEINKNILIVIISALLLASVIFFYNRGRNGFFEPTPTNLPQDLQETNREAFTVLAEELEIPWDLAVLPSGEILVTERPGRLVKIGAGSQVIEVGGVYHIGEGGLQGITLHPDFEKNNFVYLYLTTRDGGRITNRVERYRLEGNSLADRTMIIEGIPGAQFHDGGQVEFGPPTACASGQADCMLYITTGDAGSPNAAQDINSLAGKTLRLQDDGEIPNDNPFGNAVYSYGHRNPQGLAWDGEGRLWATEHGRSGLFSGFDELNMIEKGANYGWPEIQGDEQKQGMRRPEIHSGSSETWAPAGIAFANGNLFYAGLRGESLYRAALRGSEVFDLVGNFRKQFGRIRAVVADSDNYLYITTSNRDGRGNVREGDDRLIRFDLKIFEEMPELGIE